MANQPDGSLFDLDMEIVRRERRVGVGGKRLLELVLKPRDHTISLLLIVRAPDTVEFRKRAGQAGFRISGTGLQDEQYATVPAGQIAQSDYPIALRKARTPDGSNQSSNATSIGREPI
jgi:hypothetical protein